MRNGNLKRWGFDEQEEEEEKRKQMERALRKRSGRVAEVAVVWAFVIGG